MKHVLLCFWGAALLLICGCRTTQQEWEDAARAGDAEAVRVVGLQAFYGSSQPVNYRKAGELFRLSAEKNADPAAQYYWGVILEKGLGMTEPDAEKAQKLYAAAQKIFARNDPAADAVADLVRGEMAFYGRGRTQNYAAAKRFYEAGAEKLSYDAAARLGALFCSGAKGVRRDPSRGRYLLDNAAFHECAEAKYELSCALAKTDPARSRELLDAAAAQLVPGALRQKAAQDKNGDWLSLLAGQGDAEALYRMAQREPDALKKLELIRESAARGNADALLSLANHYRKTGDLPRLTIVAQCGAKQGLPVSLEGAGTRYLLPVRALWRARGADRLLKLDSAFDRYADGFRAGIAGSRTNFQNALKENPFPAYYGGDVFRVVSQELPPAWAGDIFRAYLKAGGKADAGFLMNYAILAGLAGQHELQNSAAQKLAILPGFKNCARLLRANALIMGGNAAQAYELLQKELQLPHSSAGRAEFRTFVTAWCPYLLIDRAKTAAVLRCRPALLVPGILPVRQKFYDYELDRELDVKPRFEEPEL